MFKKVFIIFSIVFLLFLIPFSFAETNDTVKLNENNEIEVLNGQNDYYFNASVIADGDGSINNPYKNLENHINAHSVNHLSNGEYTIGENVCLGEVSFIGQDAEKTIINCRGESLNVTRTLSLNNVTLVDFTIINNGVLNSQNSIFSYGYAYSQDKNGNSYGGAIYTPYTSSKLFKVTLDNCTFLDNFAHYGGAIYMDGGELSIKNSQFINNTAYNYGGAIACEYNTQISINKTRFINSKSVNDAGGAIYLKSADLNMNYVDIINSSSTFGGAITALNSNISLNRLNCYDNTARYSGGAVYQLYGKFLIQQSNFNNNSAKNGGALFLDNLSSILIISNNFKDNIALDYGGAIYSISNPKITSRNIFNNNKATKYNDLFETDSIDIFEIGQGNYTIFINDDAWNGVIPDKFDLRNYSYVSSIKNQESGGNCWAFAGIAALESCILKASGKEFDLSEENMKNLIELYSDYGWKMDTNEGGYNNMAIGYLTSWLGPIYELNDPYDDHSTLSPLLDSIMHVQNVVFLKRDNYTDNDAIKRAILKYGGVATGICYYSEYLKGYSYYCNKIFDYANHAVTIVGWDDNYSKENFRGSPEIDGAWIVKNSWGASWGDNGYFYVSYCDKKLAQVGVSESSYTFILNDSMKYDKNYQYDVIGKTNYFSTNENQIFYQNTFKATDNEILAAVSTHFERESFYDLSIYVNDVLKLNQSGISNAGYYTIKLNELLPLNLGDSFKVIFKLSGNGSYRVPISEKSYTNKFLSKEGISFFSYDGDRWFDLYTSSAPSVASIKAFTLLNKVKTNLTLNIENNQINPVEIIAEIFDEYGNTVKSGNVTFIIENKSHIVFVENGLAKIYHNFTKGGLKNVTAFFEGIVYDKSNSTTVFNVNITETHVICQNLTKYYGDSIIYSIKLVDEDNNVLAGKKIQFKVNNNIYENITNEYGIALINLNLDIGEYKIDLIFSGDNKYITSTNSSNINVKTTIIPTDVNKFTYNSNYVAKLLDLNGSILANQKIQVSINSKLYVFSTDVNGDLKVKIDFNPGRYCVKITNPNTGETSIKNIDVVSRITGNRDLTMYLGAKKIYKVRVFDDYGNPLKELASIKFTVSGKITYKNTDKKGYVSLPISLNSGKYTLIVEYKGFKVSNKITVKSTLTAKDKSIKKGKTLKFQAKLINSNAQPLKGKKITFKINGKKYTAKTNKKGFATIKIKNLKAGKYKIQSSYGKVKISNKIIVK